MSFNDSTIDYVENVFFVISHSGFGENNSGLKKTKVTFNGSTRELERFSAECDKVINTIKSMNRYLLEEIETIEEKDKKMYNLDPDKYYELLLESEEYLGKYLTTGYSGSSGVDRIYKNSRDIADTFLTRSSYDDNSSDTGEINKMASLADKVLDGSKLSMATFYKKVLMLYIQKYTSYVRGVSMSSVFSIITKDLIQYVDMEILAIHNLYSKVRQYCKK